MVLVAVDVRRPGSPITGLKHFTFRIGPVRAGRQKAWKPDYGIETRRYQAIARQYATRQKAWKPDYGIETLAISNKALEAFSVRRPGSPITGLKHLVRSHLRAPSWRQKAWKPDYGIETLNV